MSFVGYVEVFGTHSSIPKVPSIDECPSHRIKTCICRLLYASIIIIESVHGYYECHWK